LTPVACNEDGPNATTTYYPAGLTLTTTPGTVYYMIVDGFNFQGTLSNGQFCVQVTNQSVIACGDTTISSGLTVLNKPVICYDSTLTIAVSGIKAPTVGTTKGFSIMVSNADISGNNDPMSTGAVVGGTGTIAVGSSGTFQTNLVNNTTGNPFGAGVYYITPVVYGNATGTGNITALTLDPNCTYTGTSVMVEFLAQGVICPTGIKELNGAAFAVTGIYPVPVKNILNIAVESAKSTTMSISINDVLGRTVASSTQSVNNGSNTISIDTQNLSSGVYTLTVNNEKQQSTVKFVKE
ncbi:MAG TPA: T9SS type A sorting domain-containing protein, partial [Bacteroidia bacterium]|nr:T9SS type A sorting domain-containing protein [Bacteroidia bacterium]HNG84893.1 T9SS type A sorting domain-containing protein [Bacteroidia bacterium]HNO81808.1 T9SS type A sorting domain-containing protein [Bacteroidia bacterium]